MKVNWAYLKKPSVIIGAVILFFILLFLMNRSGSGASSQTVVSSGPTDAQVAQQTQLAMAQMSAGLQGQAIAIDYAKSQDANATGLAIAQIQATLSGQSLQVQQDIATQTVAAQVHGLDLQYATGLAQNSFALDYAQQQFSYGIASQAITANEQMKMSEDQLAAFKFSTLASIIPTLKSGKRDNAFSLLTTASYNPTTVSPGTSVQIMAPNGGSGQSGGFNPLAIISPVASLL